MLKICKRVNFIIQKCMTSIGGLSYRHCELEDFTSGLFETNQVFLSGIGCDIFIAGLQNVIELALQRLCVPCQ